MPISATDLNKAYLAYFGRPADATGRAYFATLEQADVIEAFDASAESKAIYGEDTASKINAIYKNLFNREAEPAGLTYWLGEISSGKVTPAGAAFAILNGALGTDKTAVENKLAASDAFIKELDTTAEIVGYSGLNAAASARAFLATVSDSADSLTAAVTGAQAAVTAAINAGTNEAGASTVLKTTQDILVGTAGNDVFRSVAGKTDGTQDQTTLNSSDIIDGAAGNDTMIVNLTGNLYQGGARLKNIETLQLGTNIAASTFDYNVNQGTNEITEVTTIVADQINGVEALTVQNIVRTDAAGAKIAPTLSWVNDSNTQAAGVVNYTYRAAELTGTADEQKISLKSVNNGDINLSAGFETISITSVGTEQVTMQPGVDNIVADVTSGSSLRTVNLAGTAEIGKNAGVVASGLTDRVVASDNGGGVAGSTAVTSSNLLSVAEVVTKVDASTAQAAVNVRFVNTDATGTNVTFLGGAGNDYVEFELGNISATGGAGNDTFAFINTGANSTFGEGDSIDGGAGSDTFQIGLNGSNVAGDYNISETELRNKSSVGEIDLRGFKTTLTLSSDFVSKADTADSITVRTDKVVQTSLTNSANGTATTPLTSFTTEDAVTNTVNLTKLSSNQSVNFVGGSGSDRIIMNDATFNVLKTINGGNYTEGTTGSNFVAGSDRYDTITVVTNGENVVIDAQDLSNVSDIEGFVLTKNSAQATYNLTLTRAFMNANTEAIDNATNTAIDDTVFQIGTTAAANNSALSGGDTVTIDVRDLLNATDTGRAAGYTRSFDVSTLINAGVAVNFIGNTGALNQAATLALLQTVDAVGQADVIGDSPAIPAGNVPIVFNGTSGNTTSGFEIAGNKIATAGNDTISVGGLVLTAAAVINGSAGIDTLTATTGANISAATIASVEALSFSGSITLTQAQYAGVGAVAVSGTSGADTLVFAAATAGAVATNASVETYDFSAGLGGGNITGSSTGSGGQTFIVGTNFTNADSLIGGTGTADVLRTDVAVGTATTDIDNVSGIETIQLTQAAGVYAWTPSNASAFDADTTAVTFNATALTTGTFALNLTNVDGRGVTVNLNSAGTGADVITVDTTVANIANAHKVSGLGAGDTIASAGAGGGVVYTVDLAAFDVASFAGSVNAALAANAAYVKAAADLILVRIGGSNTNVYAVEDLTGNGVDGTDAVVHLVGTHSITIDGTVIV